MKHVSRAAAGLCLVLAVVPVVGSDKARTFESRDTLSIVPDASTDAQQMLDALAWAPGPFAVTCEREPDAPYDTLARYPSPTPTVEGHNEMVTMEWYAPRPRSGRDVTAPAVLVLHESGRQMLVARIFARSLRAAGLHAFVMHMPGYGKRPRQTGHPEGTAMLPRVRQAMSDARRAFDAIRVLPGVNPKAIGIMGISLGGFVTPVSASLDGCFTNVFVVVAGGELHSMVTRSKGEAAAARAALVGAEISGKALKQALYQIEPTRVAHRLDPQRTWLFSAIHDQVVPLKNGRALARAVGLDGEHHLELVGNHTSAAIHIPYVLNHIKRQMHHHDPLPPEPPGPRRGPE